MNCPYCTKRILGMTGLQEALSFRKHLAKCRKNPNNVALTDGRKTAVVPFQYQGLIDALNIRSQSGQ